MADAAAVQAYVTQWSPAAKQAGAQLGVPWQWILSAWADENYHGLTCQG